MDDRILKYTDNPQKCNYILYRDLENHHKIITHVGVMYDNDMVISKWASGPLLKHKIFDVPKSYGDDILYVKSILKKEAWALYKKSNIKP